MPLIRCVYDLCDALGQSSTILLINAISPWSMLALMHFSAIIITATVSVDENVHLKALACRAYFCQMWSHQQHYHDRYTKWSTPYQGQNLHLPVKEDKEEKENCVQWTAVISIEWPSDERQ